jgi:hypothetical protein
MVSGTFFNLPEDHGDRNSHATDAGPPSQNLCIEADPIKRRHARPAPPLNHAPSRKDNWCRGDGPPIEQKCLPEIPAPVLPCTLGWLVKRPLGCLWLFFCPRLFMPHLLSPFRLRNSPPCNSLYRAGGEFTNRRRAAAFLAPLLLSSSLRDTRLLDFFHERARSNSQAG